MAPYQLLFLDIDGTLVGGNGIVSNRTRAALHRAQEQGATLVVCTGRNRHSALKVASQIGGHGYGIVLNGAVVFDWQTGAMLRQILLPRETAQAAIHLAHRHNLAPIWMGTEANDNLLYTDNLAPQWPSYYAGNAARMVVCADLAAEMPSPPASLACYGTPEQTEALAADWQAAFGKSVLTVAAPTAPYGSWYAQMQASEAHKGAAAQAVAEALHIPRSQTLAIGDQLNDLELLEWAGLGICMGDGHPGAIACADFVTGTLEEDGAAQAIERFVLAS